MTLSSGTVRHSGGQCSQHCEPDGAGQCYLVPSCHRGKGPALFLHWQPCGKPLPDLPYIPGQRCGRRGVELLKLVKQKVGEIITAAGTEEHDGRRMRPNRTSKGDVNFQLGVSMHPLYCPLCLRLATF